VAFFHYKLITKLYVRLVLGGGVGRKTADGGHDNIDFKHHAGLEERQICEGYSR